MEELKLSEDQRDIVTPAKKQRKLKAASIGKTKGKDREKEKDKEKPRTPSGQIISQSVKDIRNFFIYEQNKHGTTDRNQSTETRALNEDMIIASPYSQRLIGSQGTRTLKDTRETLDDWTIVKGKSIARHSNIVAQTSRAERYKQTLDIFTQSKKKPTKQSDNRFSHLSVFDDQSSMDQSTIDEENEIALEQQKEAETNELQLRGAEMQPKDIKDPTEAVENSITDKEFNSAISGTNNSKMDNNPKVMDVQLVMRMFSEIKSELSSIKTKNQVLEGSTAAIAQSQVTVNTEIDELRDEVCNVKKQNAVLASVVGRLGNMYVDLQKKVEQMETRAMRSSIVISGMKTEDKIVQCQKAVEKFIKETLKVENIEIIDCFKLGKGANKPIVIAVQSVQQKHELFQKNLEYNKEEQNKEREQIYMNDYVPLEIMEQRRHEREIYKENEANQSSNVTMTIDRRGLTVYGKKYEQKVSPPDSTKILSFDEKEIEDTLSMELPSGNWFHFNDNAFIAHKVAVASHEEINRAYMKMRILYPQAKHILCGFTLPGLPKCFQESYCDDGDHGCGKALLKLLQKNKIYNIAVFVVRICQQNKIGSKRFELIERATLSAFQKHPLNTITNMNQEIVLNEPEGDPLSKNVIGSKYGNRSRREDKRGRGRGMQGRSIHSSSPTSPTNDRNKRRRYEDNNPIDHEWSTDDQYRFSNPLNFYDPSQNENFETTRLGSSWPSLAEARGMPTKSNRNGQSSTT